MLSAKRLHYTEELKKRQRLELSEILNELSTKDSISYEQIGKIMGLTRERVRQLLKEFQFIGTYKAIKKAQSETARQSKVVDPLIEVNRYLSSLNLDENIVRKIINKKYQCTCRIQQTKTKDSQFMNAIKTLQKNGVCINNLYIGEIADALHARGLLLGNTKEHIRTKMNQNRIEYKRFRNKGSKTREEFLKKMKNTGIDFKNGNTKIIYQALLHKKIINPKLNYNTFYHRCKTYGLL